MAGLMGLGLMGLVWQERCGLSDHILILVT